MISGTGFPSVATEASEKCKGVHVKVRWELLPEHVSAEGINHPFCAVFVSIQNNSGYDLDYLNVVLKRWKRSTADASEFAHIKSVPFLRGDIAKKEFSIISDAGETIGHFWNHTHFSIGRIYGSCEEGGFIIDKSYEKHCAVATAACGDEDHPIVKEFRRFRSEVLMKNPVGRAFCSWYYRNGPTLAAPLAKSPALRALVRGPLIAGAGAIRLGRRLFSSAPTHQP
jgi:hypothetical protein